ncbi:DUF4405 domain-containing protein [Methanolobus profundi]|uniref:Flavinylation-associated cytochrome domain-containing protein n=1 Tax=Methanolobus profundi TaxID=487685 RepID=A0A1I4NQ17_9EURY|nr:DUF4405 domain-containing protein [Methanolobus profundi]SFM17407.1 protein of unknown function [Methanolobus profundi]
MNRTKLNYSIDLVLIILFLIVAITGAVMYFMMPSGVPRGRYQEYIGITKATWTLIHNRSAFLMILFTGIHLALHKKWMCCVTKNVLRKEDTDCTLE